MRCKQNQFPVPEVSHPDLAGEVRGQEALYKSCERANVARLGEHRLKLAVGREDAVQLG